MALLCPFLGMACLWDYCERRIPNMIPFMIFGAGLIYRYSIWGWKGIAGFLINISATILILFPLFRLGMLGGGDVKLISTSVGFFSGKDAMIFVLMIFFVSAIPAALKLIRTRSIRERFVYFFRYMYGSTLKKKPDLYLSEREEKKRFGVALSGPILISALMHWGGVF